jgi:hypothetical protein
LKKGLLLRLLARGIPCPIDWAHSWSRTNRSSPEGGRESLWRLREGHFAASGRSPQETLQILLGRDQQTLDSDLSSSVVGPIMGQPVEKLPG